MSKLYVSRGLPASGKSTAAHNWLHELGAPLERAVVSRDAIRKAQFGANKTVLSYEREQLVTKIQQFTVSTLLEGGYDVIIDDMNLRPKYVREWRRLAQRHKADFEVGEFSIQVDEAISRDAQREDGVGSKVIIELAQKFYPKGKFLPVPDEVEEPKPDKYVRDLEKDEAFVVDIDGTLALNLGGRSYYDLTRVGEDTLNLPVMEIICALRKEGFQIIFCSGRDESSRHETQLWLNNNLPVWARSSPLIMRKEGDQRRDFIVKSELFDNEIATRYDVRGIFDDRPSVIRMWQAKGLTTFALGDQSIEF